MTQTRVKAEAQEEPARTRVVLAPTEVMLSSHEMRGLVRTYFDVQVYRKKAKQRELIVGVTQFAFNDLATLEGKLGRLIKKTGYDQHPIWTDWLRDVQGVGPIITSGLLSADINVAICDKPSRLWRFAGVGMTPQEDGPPLAQRLRRGQKRDYNGFLRFMLELAVSSMLKQGEDSSLYTRLYYGFKATSRANRSGLEPIHHHRRAVMQTQRVFLDHMLRVWRKGEGLPEPRRPYAVATDPVHEFIEVPWAK